MRGTVLYDEHGETECFAGPLAEIAHEANLQAEEFHKEEVNKCKRRIESKICVQLLYMLSL